MRGAYYGLTRAARRIEWWLLDRLPQPPGQALPPARLRFKVSENARAANFVDVGRRTAANLLEALETTRFRLEAGQSVLDFGCGCGRTLLWLCDRFPEVGWYGTDVDTEAIAWCSRRFPRATFTVNGPLPPLAFPRDRFDLVFGVSVFTHLSEEYQKVWLAELNRILKPGGVLLLSFYSQHVWAPLAGAAAVERGEFVFQTSAKWKGILPDWYQTALQNETRIVEMIEAAGFTDVGHMTRRFGDQDVAAARKVRPAP